MKSIRLSVIVYCLGLLAAAEALVFWLAYRSTAAGLAERQAVYTSLLREQHNRRIRDERKKLDDELLETAREVALISSRQSQWDKIRLTALFPLAQMSSQQAHLTLPLWESEVQGRFGSTLRGRIVQSLFSDVALPDASLPRSPHGDSESFQINSEWGRRWATATMPFTGNEFAGSELTPDWKHDDLTLADGRHVRRVMYKTAISTRFIFRGRPPGSSPSPGGRSRGADAPPSRERPPEQSTPPPPQTPWLVIHVARDLGRYEAIFHQLEADMTKALADKEESDRTALASLRTRQYIIAGLTALATLAGGLVLVGIGLAPLRRLSEAVSQVSPRDFRLPIPDGESLGVELDPIADRLRHTLDQLRRAFEREKQASADISHELRTPVASLLATLDVALRKPRPAEEYRRVLEDCRGIGRQMRVLVERLLALARIDAGSDRIRPCDVEVGELVGACAALVRPLAAERGLKLEVDCSPDVTWATDPDKLREVIVNLLHNAVQYNKPDGTIAVTARADGDVLDVCVSDTGVGIAPDKVGHIFERFYRADPSRSGNELHAGLGLSIVKGYVGMMGGTVSVESQTGRGSRFRVRLPAASLPG